MDTTIQAERAQIAAQDAKRSELAMLSPKESTEESKKAGETAHDTLPEVDQAALSEAVEKVKNSVRNVQRALEFSVDEDSGRTIITVVDRETDEVIRQIPPKEILSISARIDTLTGLLVRNEV
ncbi:MAG: flagellar protein FlaG [Pseudomonadota bacterium]